MNMRLKLSLSAVLDDVSLSRALVGSIDGCTSNLQRSLVAIRHATQTSRESQFD
jgi:hypothetical protein